MKNFFTNRLFLLLVIIPSIGFITFLADTGCNNTNSVSFVQPSFNESYNEIRYPGDEYSDVVFNHKEHSARYNSECIKCHNCINASGNENWNCRSCHNPLDTQSRCGVTDEYNHGCTYAHCDRCHNGLGANTEPDPDKKPHNCIYCHLGGNTGAPLSVNPVLEKLDNTTVKLTFNRVVDQISAELTDNYDVSIASAAPDNPTSATQKNNVEIELTIANISGLTSGQTVIVTVTGVTDLDGTAISSPSNNNIATYVEP